MDGNPPSAFASSSTEIGSSLGGSRVTGTLGSNLPAIILDRRKGSQSYDKGNVVARNHSEKMD